MRDGGRVAEASGPLREAHFPGKIKPLAWLSADIPRSLF